MKKISTFLLLLVAVYKLYAGGDEPAYAVSKIPKNLLEDAHVVYREDKGHFEIKAIDKAVYTMRKVITILNESGKNHAIMATFYDNLRKVTEFSAVIYDKNGNQIDKLKKSDIVDRSYIDGGTLYDDSRVLVADLSQKEYPYTVAYDIEVTYKFLYSIPDWVVQNSENDAIEYSEYKVTAPAALIPRYKQVNFDQNPETFNYGDLQTWMWSFSNLPAIEFEPLSKGYLNVSPIIRVAPNKFKFEDYEGSFETWDDIARWQNKLNEQRNTLSEERIAEVRKLVADKTTIEEKTKTIYEYMQNRTRYVSIQLGIGGFQPFESGVVDEMGYGDCKALSFYTQSLLEAVGVDAYYTWVYGGKNPPPVDPEFPDDTFNHIILCVPAEQDTIWLECTSQTNPMGYLGGFTGDRDVLVIDSDKGHIIHTPSYEDETNSINTQAKVTIDLEGNADVDINTVFKGMGSEYQGLYYYIQLTDKDKEKWLTKNYSLNNAQIKSFKFTEKKSRIPEIKLTSTVEARKLASVSGKRIFFAPNILSTFNFVPPHDNDRASPIYINDGRLFTDSITFNIPKNVRIEYLPESEEVVTDFGQIKVEYTRNEEGQIIFKRTFKLKKGKYNADRYDELTEFLKKVTKIDKTKIVLNKTT